MPSRDPQDRSLIASIASHSSWAKTTDRTARTAKAREAWNARFEKQVDPDGKLDPVVRAKLAENARTAFYKQMHRKSAETRRRRAAERDAARPDSVTAADRLRAQRGERSA